MSEVEYYNKIKKVVLQHYLNGIRIIIIPLDQKNEEKINPKLKEKLIVMSSNEKL